jgi:hypothetical protein
MQGAPKKTSGRSYSQVRPVARHFVCGKGCIRGAILKCLKILIGGAELLGRNCQRDGKNYGVRKTDGLLRGGQVMRLDPWR